MNRSLLDIKGDPIGGVSVHTRRGYSEGAQTIFLGGLPMKQNNSTNCSLRSKLKVDRVETGEFGADMAVSLLNDGPVTFLLNA